MTQPETTVLFFSPGDFASHSPFARRDGQKDPSTVMGEITAGIILGPTVLGNVAPSWEQFLFPSHGDNALMLQAFATVSVALFCWWQGLNWI